MPSETMPPPARVSDALFPVRRPAPKPVKQRTPIKRTAPPKRANVKRKRSEFRRCYHSSARVEWVKMQPCIVCGCGPCENAHIENGGMGRKADYTKIVPLCGLWPNYRHHHKLHFLGVKTFQHVYDVDLAALAAETERRWQKHKKQEAVA